MALTTQYCHMSPGPMYSGGLYKESGLGCVCKVNCKEICFGAVGERGKGAKSAETRAKGSSFQVAGSATGVQHIYEQRRCAMRDRGMRPVKYAAAGQRAEA